MRGGLATEEIGKILSVFGIALLELWAAVPAGFVLQLPALVTAIAAAAGATAGMLMVVFLGEGIRSRLLRWRGVDPADEGGRLQRL